MGAIHRVIPDDRPGQVWWFHGNSGSGKTNIALKFDVPNKIVLDADDFREMVQSIRALESALGGPAKEVAPCESETVILQRRSIFASRNIQKGAKISEEMSDILRPQKGLLPKHKPAVIGRVAQVDIKSGEPITWDKI